ncbi:DNA/RNA helicase domain-containing protein [Acinetobacter bereziniae]|uniref:DNA/RNA helicase domain-containing protein n=1 Tax=Acinetobacter bereziniae TaxID=106648 RepID=UPI00124E54D6|nr:DNA/RNA helicase domain-containing protein [Acinetobacter bereziniae]
MKKNAGWSGYWDDFLNITKEQFINSLTEYCLSLEWIGSVSKEQVTSWEIEFDVMKATIQTILDETDRSFAKKSWIAFEHELPGENGRRAADVNIVLSSGYLFVIEFKNKLFTTRTEIKRAEFDLQTLQTFHSESKNLIGIGYLVLTREEASVFDDRNIHCDISEGNILKNLKNDLIYKLKEEERYNVSQWENGQFFRPFNLMRGTVDLFLKADFSHLKSSEVAKSIYESKEEVLRIFAHAKEMKQKHIVIVSGVPGAGKTLLGLTTIAEISEKYKHEELMPLYMSGNGPLVSVLRYTLDYASEKLKKSVNSRTLIESMINFKSTYLQHSRINSSHENFIVFDEAQRAWKNLGKRSFNHDGINQTELHLLCNWLNNKEYGVLVLLFGDGQIIHDNEMDTSEWSKEFHSAVTQWGRDFIVHAPDKFFLSKDCVYDITVQNKLLFLDKEIRQRYTQNLSLWIDAVINNRPKEANSLVNKITNYELRVTSNKETAEKEALDLLKGLHQKNLKENHFKIGWLESSKGSNMLKQLGYNATEKEIGQWYVEPEGSKKSSCEFDKSATEFSCQGLELDYALLNWGNDLLFSKGVLVPTKRKNTDYTLGAYKVLLSRGRNGLIIKVDHPETYQYLKQCGMKELIT